jgi:MFS family permease
MLTAEGAGGIVAGILTRWVSRRFSPGPLLSWSNIAAGCVAVTIAVAATVPVTFAGIAVAGFLILFAVVSLNTLLQSEVPDRVRGRVFGTYLTVSAMASLLGSSVASLLADRIGIRLMFGLGGSLYGVGGLICLFALVPALRRARSTSETATIC